MKMLELIRRCPYCRRESNVSADSYAENPYCSQCLTERLQKAKENLGPVEFKTFGQYTRIIPVSQTP